MLLYIFFLLLTEFLRHLPVSKPLFSLLNILKTIFNDKNVMLVYKGRDL